MARNSGRPSKAEIRRAAQARSRITDQSLERAALRATDTARLRAIARFRSQMSGAGLAGLGRAVSSTSDFKKGRGVYRRGGKSWSASGIVYQRARSPRSTGALESYLYGADIRPVRSRWLWIPTDEIQRIVGTGANKRRLTPALWKSRGLETKVGPLVTIRSVNGNPLLVARNVGVNAAGKPRSAKSLTKAGRPRKGQRLKEFVVAFVGIPRTSRAARVDIDQIMNAVRMELPMLFANELRKEGTRGGR